MRLERLIILASSCTALAELPTLHVSAPDTVAGHRLVGRRVGEAFGKQIRAAFDSDVELHSAVMQPDVQPLLSALIEYHKSHYPLYWAEVEGTADAAELPIRLVAAANFRQEITSVMGAPSSHCTDVWFTNGSTLALAHNEDYYPFFFDSMYILSVRFGAEQGHPHSFTAFCYPALLPGWAVGLREHFAFSVNLLSPKLENPQAVDSRLLSVVFALRDVLSARDVPSAVAVTASSELRYGYSLNLLDVGRFELHQMEVAPGGLVSQEFASRAVPAVGAHANAYLRLTDIPQFSSKLNSSWHRVARFEQLRPHVRKPKDLLNILGDTMVADWPLFRSALPPDTGANMATWALDLDQKVAHVYRHRPDGRRFSPTEEFWSKPLLRVPFPAQGDGVTVIVE